MVTVLVATAHGLGRHAFTLSREDQIVYGKMVFVQAILTTTSSLCLLKLSVAVSLLRLSGPAAGINRYYRRIIWALIGTRCVCYLGGPDKTPEPAPDGAGCGVLGFLFGPHVCPKFANTGPKDSFAFIW